MSESLKEVYEIFKTDTRIQMDIPIEDSIYGNQELGHMWMSENLLNCETPFDNVRKSSKNLVCYDDLYIEKLYNTSTNINLINMKEFTRTVNKLGLFADSIKQKSIMAFKIPKTYEGSLSFGKINLYINTNEPSIKINCIDEKYRFCLNKQAKQIMIDMKHLNFKGTVKSNEYNIKYKRKIPDFKSAFIESNIKTPISDIFNWIALFNLDPIEIMDQKIDEFINGKVFSSIILKDLSYLSLKFNISKLEISRLVFYLQDCISNCIVERDTYRLFIEVLFLVYIGKLKFETPTEHHNKIIEFKNIDNSHHNWREICHPNSKTKFLKLIKRPFAYLNSKNIQEKAALDPTFNFPFLRDPVIPVENFVFISNSVVNMIQDIILTKGIVKSSLIEIFQLLKTYKQIGMPLNHFFVSKIFSFFTSHTKLSQIFQYKLGICPNESSFSYITELFQKSLNESIKKSTNIDGLYEMFITCFKIKKKKYLSTFLETVFKVHLKRINKCTAIDKLKPIKESIIKCEKVFGKRDIESDIKLKEKAASFISAKIGR